VIREQLILSVLDMYLKMSCTFSEVVHFSPLTMKGTCDHQYSLEGIKAT